MKKLSFFSLLLVSSMALAQSPNALSYQAVVRNSSNELVKSQNVSSRFSILKGSVSGTVVYSETQSQSTNVNGLLTSRIGNGTVVSGSFSGIDWSNDIYFIKTETDPNGGNNYSIIGTSQLLSVPYALYAKTSGSSTPGPKGDTGATGPKGDKGDTGLQGVKGDKGDAGAAGAKGDKGDTGSIGATGPKGDTGLQGVKGDKGDAGAAGAKGDKGDTGSIGATGPKGDTGLQGVKGDKGDTGSAGAIGATGPKGDTGLQGAKGDKGDAGAAGAKGDTGAIGATGPKGDTGLQGVKGDKGDTGTAGAKGDKGDKGDIGNAGQGFANGSAAGQVYLTGSSPYAPQAPVSVSGDVTINSSGATAIGDSKVTTSKINDGAVTIAKLSATGTKDSSTYLRGDGTWSAPASSGGGGFPVTTVNSDTTLSTANQIVNLTGNYTVKLPSAPANGQIVYVISISATGRINGNGKFVVLQDGSALSGFDYGAYSGGYRISILIYNGTSWYNGF